jgi:hypothetical protein
MPTWKPTEPRPERPTPSQYLLDSRLRSTGGTNQDGRFLLNRKQRLAVLKPTKFGTGTPAELQAATILKNEELYR